VFQREPRVVLPDHREWVVTLRCLICAGFPTEAAHLRYADARYRKPPAGMQEKSDDFWTLPLCADCHRLGRDAQHNSNEHQWWADHLPAGDPLALCLYLHFVCFPHTFAAEQVLEQWRPAR
jgi:hypothetical protein